VRGSNGFKDSELGRIIWLGFQDVELVVTNELGSLLERRKFAGSHSWRVSNKDKVGGIEICTAGRASEN
jgi:hypothetical protein